jgi:hypothetical protein
MEQHFKALDHARNEALAAHELLWYNNACSIMDLVARDWLT